MRAPIVWRDGAAVRGIYGPRLAGGSTPLASARAALDAFAGARGVEGGNLQARSWPGREGPLLPLMTDPTGAGPKFWFYACDQSLDGIPVLGAWAGVLVRNVPGFPAVAVKSTLAQVPGLGGPERAVAAAPNVIGALENARRAEPGLRDPVGARAALWIEGGARPARVVVEFSGDVGRAGEPGFDRRRFIADAVTGEVLRSQSVLCDLDVTVTTAGKATQGLAASSCAPVASAALPDVAVTLNGATYYADGSGTLWLPWGGTDPVSVGASMSGLHFATHRYTGGADETLSAMITPPGQAGLVFNASNGVEDFRSAVNAYRHASIAYHFFEGAVPTLVQSECPVPFDIYVHRSGPSGQRSFFVPPRGDHCSDGSRASINFAQSASSKPSPSFSTVVYHEYGHQLISMQGYSGVTSFNEGMADAIAMLVSDQPDMGVGLMGNCQTPVRSAANTLTYPCLDPYDVHTCGSLVSGCFWEWRQRLAVTEPATYRQTLADIALASVPIYSGSDGVDPSLFLDVLTLDDNDGDVSNGTPHWNQIQAAFGVHRMTMADFAGAGLPLQAGPLGFEFSPEPPTAVLPGGAPAFDVLVTPMYGNTPQDGTAWLCSDESGDGSFTERPLERVGPNHYVARPPVAPFGHGVRYYVKARTTGGADSVYPPGAPDQCLTLVTAGQSETAAQFEFDGSMDGWTSDPANVFVPLQPQIGLFQASLPPIGPDLDLSTVLGTSTAAGQSQTQDVFGGTATSPAFDTSGCRAVRVSYARWYWDPAGKKKSPDYATVEISYDNGQSWTVLDQAGPGGPESDGGWRYRSFMVQPSAVTRLRVVRHHGTDQPLVFIFLDHLEVSRVTGCPADFDGSGFVNGEDMDAFGLAFFNGDPCADFDGNGFVNGEDFDAFSLAFFYGC